MANKRGLPVSYTLNKFTQSERENTLLQIISSVEDKDSAPLNINQDLSAFVSELTDKDTDISFSIKNGRQVYLYCFEGGVKINDEIVLDTMDSIEIRDEAELKIRLNSDMAHFIILEMAKSE
jgi:redox-sensitive bicupin YhaK (pirin superfamily)